jgi:sporulation protein YlmC with PRC-barrel domain
MDHPKPGLKYVDAQDLDDSAKQVTGLSVLGNDGEKLGEVEGFVMDLAEGKPRHVVVGAGWFIHKHFLLPIGHAALSDDGKALVADITKERVKRFPGFDKDEFEKLSPADLSRLDSAMTDTWGATDVAHYDVPYWWQEDFYRDRPGSGR